MQIGSDKWSRVQPNGALGITWSEHTWPGALQWRIGAGERVVDWQLALTVTTGFIGKGPLAGYCELRRISADAVVPIESAQLGK